MKKEFIIVPTSGDIDIYWTADDYTEEEINVIKKFLKDMNERREGLAEIHDICIIDSDDEE